MRYDPSKGIFGNLTTLFRTTTQTDATVTSNKASYDADHIQMEREHTDADLNNIEAQQLITELDLRVMELEGN